MPIAKMKKLLGVGALDEQEKLLKLLTKLGCVEVAKSDYSDGGTSLCNTDVLKDKVTIKLAKIEFANRFLAEQIRTALATKDYKSYKKPLIARKPEIGFEEFYSLREKEAPIFEKIKRLEEYNEELLKLKAEESRSNTLIEQLIVYKDINYIINDFIDTKNVGILLGTLAKVKLEALDNIKNAYSNVIIEVVGDDKDVAVVAICLKEEKDALYEELSAIEFTLNNLNINEIPMDVLVRERENIKQINTRKKNINETIVKEYDNAEFTSQRRLLTDFYKVELQKLEAEGRMVKTAKTFVFSAWIPVDAEEIITKKLEKSDLTLAYFARELEEGEEPPTLCVNNAIVTPYQSITNMFSAPSYGEVNPNPFVCFFYVVFFGMMISDAGYGLLLVLATSIILVIAKPRKNEMGLIKIFLMGGLSTIVWGVLFGGYFGIENFPIPPILFNPIYSPMEMLMLSLGLGLVQMFTGMAINAYSLFKAKKPLDAIFGVFSWYILAIGIAVFAFVKSNIKFLGVALLALGIIGLMLSGAIHKKGIKRFSGAFASLYSIINFFSDLLSYTRLFGLGLATGVIAMVFNQIALVMIDLIPIVGYVLAVVLLLVGHLFNLGINTLGAYVHNSRLQFVEFFGKFYTGGGELFLPLGSDMKYYNLNQISED